MNPKIWLVWGARGWIGSMVVKILENLGERVIGANSRCDNEEEVEDEILLHKPDRLISLTGRTSGPGINNIDYLQNHDKLVENVRDNLYGPMILAMLSEKYKIHYTYLGTGCIFDGYEGYTEEDKPDFFGSNYSVVKGFTDRLMHSFDSVLNVRIRMAIIDSHDPKNFITKITIYKKICSMKNSMTNLNELLPIMIQMAKDKTVGTINLVNPGLIDHNEILTMYKEIVDPEFTWENFTLEEQSKVLLSARSNNLLNTDKLEKLFPTVLPIAESVRQALLTIKNNK